MMFSFMKKKTFKVAYFKISIFVRRKKKKKKKSSGKISRQLVPSSLSGVEVNPFFFSFGKINISLSSSSVKETN